MKKEQNFSNRYKILYKIFQNFYKSSSSGEKGSEDAMSKYLAIPRGRFQAWKRGQIPSAVDCQTLADKLDISIRWIITGDGAPFTKERATDFRELHPEDMMISPRELSQKLGADSPEYGLSCVPLDPLERLRMTAGLPQDVFSISAFLELPKEEVSDFMLRSAERRRERDSYLTNHHDDTSGAPPFLSLPESWVKAALKRGISPEWLNKAVYPIYEAQSVRNDLVALDGILDRLIEHGASPEQIQEAILAFVKKRTE